jgi:hypothetical protein
MRVYPKSGYMGEDSMRAKAERMLGVHEIKEPKGSFSSTEHEKMRLFKKGGHVKKTTEMRKAMKGRSKSPHTPPLNIESAMEMKKMSKGGKMCYAMGGVGKIRHKEATASGMPIKKKSKVKHD